MTARFVTTLGALALGLAAFAASPVMAQGAGGGAGGAAGGGNVPSGTPTTTNAGEGHPGPQGNATQMGNPATTGTLGQSMAPAVRPMHHGRMASSGHMAHHATMHSKGRMARSGGDTAAGDAAVNRLNEQSLMAAQKGTNYMPSAAQ
ncbi:MAG: hypothetical protein ABI369_07895 [Acetobacteraceae bacterium]